MNEEDLYRLAEQAGFRLQERGLRLVTAESCTGGWLAQCVTDVAGSSGWFECGLVSYSNASKCALLGVKAETLETDGAVSEATVRAMTAGALHRCAADIAVAVSGIAGPGGGTPLKPVGTVWLAWERRDQGCTTRLLTLTGNRRTIRRQAVLAALQGIMTLCE